MTTIEQLSRRVEELEKTIRKLNDPYRIRAINLAADTISQSIPDVPLSGAVQAAAAQSAREGAAALYDSALPLNYYNGSAELFGRQVDYTSPAVIANIIDLASSPIVRRGYAAQYSRFLSKQNVEEVGNLYDDEIRLELRKIPFERLNIGESNSLYNRNVMTLVESAIAHNVLTSLSKHGLFSYERIYLD